MIRTVGWVAAAISGLICLAVFGILISQPEEKLSPRPEKTDVSDHGCLFLDTAWLGAVSPCGDGLAAGNSRGEVLFFDHLEKGTKPRIFPLSKYAISAPPLVREGVCFVGDENGTFWAFRPEKGLLWSFRTGNQITGGAVWCDGSIWVGSHDQSLYAFDPKEGTVLQTLECDGQINGSPLFSDSLKAIFVGSCDGFLRKIDTRTGKRVAELDFHSPIPQSPVLADGVLYLLTHQGVLAAVDAETFQPRYQITLKGRHFLTSPTIQGDLLLLTDESGKIEVRSARDGSFLAWLPSEEKMTAPQVVFDDRIYAVSKQGKLFCWQLQNGTWTSQLAADFHSDFAYGCVRMGNRLILVDENGGLFYYAYLKIGT